MSFLCMILLFLYLETQLWHANLTFSHLGPPLPIRATNCIRQCGRQLSILHLRRGDWFRLSLLGEGEHRCRKTCLPRLLELVLLVGIHDFFIPASSVWSVLSIKLIMQSLFMRILFVSIGHAVQPGRHCRIHVHTVVYRMQLLFPEYIILPEAGNNVH